MTEETDLEKIRKRPGMYVGSTVDPPYTIMEEALSNAFDEYLAGRARHIEVVLHADGGVTIGDDGAGISRSTLEEALTSLHDLPTLKGHRPHVHLTGLRGLGIFVVAAVCETFAVQTVEHGQAHSWELVRGVPRGPIQTVAHSGPSGTRVRFRVDSEIFRNPDLPRAWVIARLEALTDLSPGLRITLRDEGYEMASPPRGISRRVRGAHTIEILEDVDDTRVHVALSWQRFFDRPNEPRIESFVNYGWTRDHGTHVLGMLDGLKDVERKLKPRRPLRERLDACVAVVTPDVQWGSPTRDQLRSPLLRPIVRRAVARGLARQLEEHPEVRAALVNRRFRD